MLSKWLGSRSEISFSNIFAMIGRIPTGLQLSFWFLEPTLKTGVILANLKEAGKIEEQIATLNQQHICSVKHSEFSFKTFMGMSESCTDLLIQKFLFSFITVFFLSWEKKELDKYLLEPQNGVNIRVTLILQNNLQGWMVRKPMMKYIYVMF